MRFWSLISENRLLLAVLGLVSSLSSSKSWLLIVKSKSVSVWQSVSLHRSSWFLVILVALSPLLAPSSDFSEFSSHALRTGTITLAMMALCLRTFFSFWRFKRFFATILLFSVLKSLYSFSSFCRAFFSSGVSLLWLSDLRYDLVLVSFCSAFLTSSLCVESSNCWSSDSAYYT